MDNYKIRVANEAESKEAKSLFESLGFEIDFSENGFRYEYLFSYKSSRRVTGDNELSHFVEKTSHKEITLPQLKDLVVLKRNDVGDANVKEENCLYDLYLTQLNDLYFYHCGKNKWILSNLSDDEDYCKLLKPIEPKMSILDTGRLEMKEYLNKITGEYKKTDAIIKGIDWIEIPAGSEAAYFFNGSDLKRGKDDIAFYKDNIGSIYNDDDWLEIDGEKVKPFVLNKGVLLWRRHTQPEELPFIDDLPITEDFIFNPSISDQYAEIEKVRQTAWDTQVGGNHYKQFKIQPMQFALENKLDAAQQNVIKYIMRHSFKNGKQDLEKAKHYIDLMIEFYYGNS